MPVVEGLLILAQSALGSGAAIDEVEDGARQAPAREAAQVFD
jgi:hypothetical protein